MSELYVRDVLTIAAGEVGYLEKASNKDLDSQTGNPGTGNWTKYARDLWEAKPHFYQSNKNGYEWCAVFVAWCLYMAADQDAQRAMDALYYTGPYGASCGFSVGYYKAAGKFRRHDPKPGDQIFFGSADDVRHTGLVEKLEYGIVTTIEGNADNAVRRRQYSLTDPDILGYGIPAYDEEAAPEPKPPEPLPTRFTDVPPDAWYTDAVVWAAENGITKGTSATTFSPQAPCTRAEAVTLLYRFAEYNEKAAAAWLQRAVAASKTGRSA